jgi:hypothetical protein
MQKSVDGIALRKMTMFDKHGMSEERWNYLMQPFDGDENVMLTADEIANGWHWCDEWDGLLIHADDREFEHCKCDFMKKFRTPARIEMMKRQQAMDRLAMLDEELGLNDIVQESDYNNSQFRKTDIE